MTFCIITHVPHVYSNGKYFGYAPYVNEMNIWLKHVDKVIVVAPLSTFDKTVLHQDYHHPCIEFVAVPQFSLISIKAMFMTIVHLPLLLSSIFKAMRQSDHIHLRCPGNMGLLGSLVQILFSKKKKTAKYAGNWDPNSKQPITYKLQKKILSSTFLTHNMTVLVYGAWPNQSKNIKSFFTATYYEAEKSVLIPKTFALGIHFLYVGSLTAGKQPIVAIKLVEALKKRNYDVHLSVYGDGDELQNCISYVRHHCLSDYVFIHKSINKVQLKQLYQDSHFLILPSKSEGWPKVVAEAMFWGCLPIATAVSCIPTMLDYGNRGVLLGASFQRNLAEIEVLLRQPMDYNLKIKEAVCWSRNFTIDTFEASIKQLVIV